MLLSYVHKLLIFTVQVNFCFLKMLHIAIHVCTMILCIIILMRTLHDTGFAIEFIMFTIDFVPFAVEFIPFVVVFVVEFCHNHIDCNLITRGSFFTM